MASDAPSSLRNRYAAGGFTYVGLLITIVLMTSALALVAPVWELANRRDKEAELLFIGGEFRRALAAYAKLGSSDADRYPKTLEDLVKDPRFAGNRRFLRKVYGDPMTNSTDWGYQRDALGGIIGVFSKAEKEPIKQTNFRAADKDFEGKTKYSEWVFTDKQRGIVTPKTETGQPGAANAVQQPGQQTNPPQPGFRQPGQ